MKASELIKQLEELKEEHGDLKVGIWDEEWDRATPILEAFKQDEGEFINFGEEPVEEWITLKGH